MKFVKNDFGKKLLSSLVRSARLAGETSGKISKQSKVKINELGIKKQIEEKLIDLGGLVYDKAIRKNNLNFEQDLIIKHLIEQIKELEQELHQLKAVSKDQ